MKLRDKMVQHPNGSWEPREPITIKSPSGEVRLSPGVRFKEGIVILGVDIKELLDMEIPDNQNKK